MSLISDIVCITSILNERVSFISGVFVEQVEEEELDEFEVLEEIADNMSLVSDSSIVRQITTPNKQRQKVIALFFV